MTKTRSTHKVYRSLWQRLCRAGAVLALALIAAYATLPWWVPCGMLGDWLERRLSEQYGLDCQVAAVSLSWSEGVRIEMLKFGNPPGFGETEMLRVGRICMPFAPLRFLLGRPIEWMEVNSAVVDVRVDSRDRVNLAALRSDRFDVQPDRITVRDTQVQVHLPERERPFLLRIHNGQFRADSDSTGGLLTVSAALAQDGTFAPVVLRADTGTDQPFSVASASVRFLDVDLGKLRLPELLPLPLDKATGRCAGSVELQLNRRLVVDRFSVDLHVKDLDVQPTGGPQLPVIADAAVRLGAAVDLLKGKIACRSLHVHLPGTELDGSAAVFTEVGEGSWRAIDSLALTGQVRPAELAAVLTGAGELPGGWSVRGPVGVQVLARREGNRLVMDLALSGARAGLSRNGRTVKDEGTPLGLKMAGALDRRSWRLDIERLALSLGGNLLSGSGTAGRVNRLLPGWSPGEDQKRADLLADVRWEGQFELTDADSLRRVLVAAFGHREASRRVRFDGTARGHYRIVDEQPRRTKVSLSFDLPAEAKLSTPWFAKPVGRRLRADVAGTFNHASNVWQPVWADVRVGEGRLGVDQAVVSLHPAEGAALGWRGEGLFAADFVESILAGVPALGELDVDCRGQLHGRFTAAGAGPRGRVHLETDLTQAAVQCGDVRLKQPGEDAHLRLNLSRGLEDGSLVDTVAADLSLPHLDARVTVSTPEAGDRAWKAGSFSLAANIREAARLVDLCGPAADVLQRSELAGSAGANLSGRWSERQVVGQVVVDATGLSFALAGGQPGRKAADVPLTLSARVRAKRGEGTFTAELTDATIALADSRVDLSARAVAGREPTGANVGERVGWSLRALEGRAGVNCRDGDALRAFLPAASGWIAGGRLEGDVCLSLARQSPRLWAGTLDIERMAGRLGGKDVGLDGRIRVGGAGLTQTRTPRLEQLASDGLRFRIGANRGWLVAELSDVLSATSGKVHLLCEYLDDKDLRDWFLGRQPAEAAPQDLTSRQKTALLDRAERVVSFLREAAARADLAAHLRVDELHTYDAAVGEMYEARNVVADLSVRGGRIETHVLAGVNGGCYRERLAVNLSEIYPMVKRQLRITDVVASENVQPQLARFFPGNTVDGYFNRTQDVEMPLRELIAGSMNVRYPLHPAGAGKTVTLDGHVRGRAAPKFVTAVFPGLNLTRYDYERMTAFSNFLPDGTVENDMIFNGSSYDIYMEGQTSPENIGTYEIGLILISSSPQWQHEWKQVRVPILKFEGRIEDGEIHDEKVSYPWPNETVFTVFLKNNIFYRIWLNTRGRGG